MSKSIALCALLVAFASSPAFAVDYLNARITGVGIGAPGEDFIRFTIDKDPSAIFVTSGYTGDQHKRLVALVYAAYTAQSPVYLIRSTESSSSGVRHYTQLSFISLGTLTFD